MPSSSNVGLHGSNGGAGWSDVSIRRRQLPDHGTVRSAAEASPGGSRDRGQAVRRPQL